MVVCALPLLRGLEPVCISVNIVKHHVILATVDKYSALLLTPQWAPQRGGSILLLRGRASTTEILLPSIQTKGVNKSQRS